jgi:FkbM family methyltransferase
VNAFCLIDNSAGAGRIAGTAGKTGVGWVASSIVQKLVLVIYRQPIVSRLLRTRAGTSLFVVCYDFYKDVFEVPGSRALARRVPPGGWVIDVGANNGYFTSRFARWVSGGGRVIAIEPDADNLALLRRRISRKGLTTVEICEAAAMERSGSIHLQRNPARPDDHRIGDTGDVVVTAVTIDELVERAGSPVVSLIKIDTQGSEPRVLAGASRTLQRCRPSLFVEIDDRALQDGGASAAQLITRLQAFDYEFFILQRSGREIRLQSSEILEALKRDQRGYLDVLCVARQSDAVHGNAPERIGE